MRNPFDGSRRGRRPARSRSVPSSRSYPGSPYDFGAREDESVDPVDMLAIHADDQLLDALGSGLPIGSGTDGDLDTGFHDDQQMLALLTAWRDEVHEEPIPELVSVEEASEAIVAGHRARRPRRRLITVAAAAVAVVLGMSGVVLGAGNAEPGDPLWGVSKALDSERAASVEAAQRVSIVLASAQEALAEGRVAEAQAKLASVTPDLDKVTDSETKDELARKKANLATTAGEADEGEHVHTDKSGNRDDGKGKDRRGATGSPGSSTDESPDQGSTGSAGSGPGSGPPGSETPTSPDTRQLEQPPSGPSQPPPSGPSQPPPSGPSQPPAPGPGLPPSPHPRPGRPPLPVAPPTSPTTPKPSTTGKPSSPKAESSNTDGGSSKPEQSGDKQQDSG